MICPPGPQPKPRPKRRDRRWPRLLHTSRWAWSAGLLLLACLAAPPASASTPGHAATHHAGASFSSVTPAYRPFLEPAPIDRYWLWLLPPLVLGIAVVYRTIKSDDLARMPRRAAYLALQVAIFLVAAAVSLWVLLRIF